jgi:hypothetical protein
MYWHCLHCYCTAYCLYCFLHVPPALPRSLSTAAPLLECSCAHMHCHSLYCYCTAYCLYCICSHLLNALANIMIVHYVQISCIRTACAAFPAHLLCPLQYSLLFFSWDAAAHTCTGTACTACVAATAHCTACTASHLTCSAQSSIHSCSSCTNVLWHCVY